MKVDLHSHTRYSRDSTMAPARLVERAREVGLDRIAVTDHNTIDGAIEAAALDPSLVIVGEEIDCAGGTDLIGLFLHERIPPGLPVLEVARRIREQGGIVYAPHPYAYLTQPSLHAMKAITVADVVEVFNSRAFMSIWNRRALWAAGARGLPIAAGTDSHFPREIGAAWTEIPAFTTAAGFRSALEAARPIARRTQHPAVHCASIAVQAGKAVTGVFSRRRPLVAPVVSGELTASGAS